MADRLHGEEAEIKVPRFNSQNGFVTTPQRSILMSKIKHKNTSPELAFRKALWKRGFRYRLHNGKLPGNPDIILKKHRIVIFIDGEFWHGYNWEEKKIKIKNNRDFWIPKIERNMQRDRRNNLALAQLGYKVFRFWEMSLKKNIDAHINEVIEFLSTKDNGSKTL